MLANTIKYEQTHANTPNTSQYTKVQADTSKCKQMLANTKEATANSSRVEGMGICLLFNNFSKDF